ncbi:hypothetical protein AC578_8286 [Pseudocercospora eumusae]|uniref:Uncharacterized protein n=1 Tax=Pseudocercospora eumusae TaxID=321146 RepID=A0A139GYW0_9PEZI|nr:hypothetical protein AC578_8286 [Pseudocercospora eumusae]
MVVSIAISFFATFTAILEARKARRYHKQEEKLANQRKSEALKKAAERDYDISNASLPSGIEIVDEYDEPRGRSATPHCNAGAISASAPVPEV